jgi:hypothetical protein
MSRLAGTLAVLLCICLPHAASAWGPDGHRVVGSIADQLLNPNAKQQIANILGVDLRTAGPWLDCVKSVHRQADGTLAYVVDPQYEPPCTPFLDDHARMVDYVGRNWIDCVYPEGASATSNLGCHNTYHFDDVAIQRDRFDRNYAGTNDHDIVAAINAAIAVLLDRPAPPPFSIKDKKEALFMLAHLVGDMTQPLHVGALYLDTKGGLADPDVTHTIDPTTETAGGNWIHDGSSAFHHEWDDIPANLGDTAPPDLVDVAKGLPADNGRIENWSVAWASDTILVAQQAVAGTTYAKTGDRKWTVAFVDRASYVRAAEAIKRRQLAKAGARLAEIMNTVWP